MSELLKVLLLADIGEPVTCGALNGHAALAFEVAAAMRDYQDVGGLHVELVARRGSWRALPLISLDPGELSGPPADALSEFAGTEALYAALVLSGVTSGYHLVHCLAPLVVPLKMIANTGTPVLQTVTTPNTHPAAILPQTLVSNKLLRQVAIFPGSFQQRMIGPPVDLDFYRPPRSSPRNSLLYLDTGDPRSKEYAAKIAGRLGVSCQGFATGGPLPRLRQLQRSLALLCLCEARDITNWIWCLRALACGIPVVAWRGDCFDSVLGEPNGFLANRGDWMGIVRHLRHVSLTPETIASRRGIILSRFGRRTIAASYREAYMALLEGQEDYFSQPRKKSG